jgi:NAD(P)-dependent dehydrogenase (short-subunit alcohol dehydrogenase family)
MVKVNVLALTHLSLAIVPGFAKRNRGTIVNLGSIIAIIPTPGGASYSASKAYVLNFSRSLQMKFKKTNVKLQVVSQHYRRAKRPFITELVDALIIVSRTNKGSVVMGAPTATKLACLM